MANNQPPLPNGEDEILTQAEAYRFMGVSRAVLRGFLERKELPVADENGVKGAARVKRSDVLRLMEKRGLAPRTAAVPEQKAEGPPCRGCDALREQMQHLQDKVQRQQDDLTRTERALHAALRLS
jgi:hypothetical protein